MASQGYGWSALILFDMLLTMVHVKAAVRKVAFFGKLTMLLGIIFSKTLAATDDQRLEAVFKKYLEQRFRLQPLDATRLGDHRFDHLLDDLSPEALKRQREFVQSTLKQLPKAVDYKKLSRDGQIDCELLEHELEAGLWLDENTKPFQTNPRIYNEYISDSVFQLLVQSPLPKENKISNAMGRL